MNQGIIKITEDVLVKGEKEYGADVSARFNAKFDRYLMWFKKI